MKCEQCGREFMSRRSSAKYCSARCRKLAFQKEKVSVPEKGVSVPESASKGKVSVLSVPKKGVSVANSDLSVAEHDLSVAEQDLSVAKGEISVAKAELAGQEEAVSWADSDLSRTDSDLSVTDEINQKLNAMKRKQKPLDKDDWDSPDYDLSEAGFIRRNQNWLDDDCFLGTEKSRQDFINTVIAQRQEVRTRRRGTTKAELREKLKGSCYSRLI